MLQNTKVPAPCVRACAIGPKLRSKHIKARGHPLGTMNMKQHFSCLLARLVCLSRRKYTPFSLLLTPAMEHQGRKPHTDTARAGYTRETRLTRPERHQKDKHKNGKSREATNAPAPAPHSPLAKIVPRSAVPHHPGPAPPVLSETATQGFRGVVVRHGCLENHPTIRCKKGGGATWFIDWFTVGVANRGSGEKGRCEQVQPTKSIVQEMVWFFLSIGRPKVHARAHERTHRPGHRQRRPDKT